MDSALDARSLAAGADPKRKDSAGLSPMQRAKASPHPKVIEALKAK